MYYQPSGKISALPAIVGIVGIILTGIVLGFVYTYAVWYIPFIYVNFFLTLGAGLGAAFAIKQLIRLLKSRSGKYNMALGLLAGLVLIYTNWAVWVDLVVNSQNSYNLGNNRIGITVSSSSIDNLMILFTHPSLIWDLAWKINDVGTWGIRGATISGGFLTVIWVIEALMLLGVSFISGWGADMEPFDESTNQWAEKQEAQSNFAFIVNPEEFKSELEARHYQLLQNLPVKSPDSIDFSEITAHYIATGDVFYLSIVNKKGKYDKEGKLEHDSSTVVQFIEVPRHICQTLLSKVEQPIESVPAEEQKP